MRTSTPRRSARAAAGAYSSTYHPDWSILAARIAVSDLHKCTEKSFAKNCAALFAHVHPKTGSPAPLIADDVNAVIQANAERFDAAIDSTRDFECVARRSAGCGHERPARAQRGP